MAAGIAICATRLRSMAQCKRWLWHLTLLLASSSCSEGSTGPRCLHHGCHALSKAHHVRSYLGPHLAAVQQACKDAHP